MYFEIQRRAALQNDPRYLKIWLEYLFGLTEGYLCILEKDWKPASIVLRSRYLETKYTDANQIYELGIQSNAFPLKRLQKSYENFKERLQLK